MHTVCATSMHFLSWFTFILPMLYVGKSLNIFNLLIICNVLFHFQRSDGFLHWSTFVSNLSCLIYYPLEHLAWLADSKLVSFSSNRLWKYAILCWVIYSAIQLMQCLYKLRMIFNNSSKQKLRKEKLMVLRLALLQYVCDVLCGLHWMPCGPLSNKLSDILVGLLGTVSSITRLHQSLTQ